MQQPDQDYQHTFKVRDYECDLQGIVNNANYQHYMEHTRHEYLHTHGISFSALHQAGTDLVVARIRIDYKAPLHSGDQFVCTLRLVRENIRYVFHHTIHRQHDGKLCARARVDVVCVRSGQLAENCPELDRLLR